jgi:hypothetical protein
MTATETFTLSRPLATHNGEVTSFTLREPTAGAFIDYGEPFKIRRRKGEDGEDSSEFEYDSKVFARFLTDMIAEKGIDDLILKGLNARDFYQLRVVATNIILLGVQDERPI